MDAQEKILQIRVNTEDAVKTMADLNKELQGLKDHEKELQKQIKELSKDEQANADVLREKRQELVATKEAEKDYSNQISQVSSSIQNELKLEREETGSLKALRAELSNATKAYDSLSRTEREGAKGQELQKHINDITNELKKAEEGTQRYQRNVGNYKSALQKTGQAFSAAGVNANVFNKSLNVISANPIVKILTALVAVMAAVIKSFKSNEEATMRLKEALAPLNPIIDAVKKGLEAFAGVIVKVVKGAVEGLTNAIAWLMEKLQALGNWFGADWHFADNFREGQKAAQEAAVALAEAENKLIKDKRAWVTESAKLDKEIADLREKASDKEKYTAQERLAFLDKAIALETEKASKEKELAEENLRLLQLEAARSANSAEMNDKLAEAERKVIEADTNLANTKRNLNKQRMAAVTAIKAEEQAAVTAAENAQKAADEAARKYQEQTVKAMQKAEDDLNNIIADAIEKRTAIENTAYQRKVDSLNAQMEAEKAAHGEETELYKAYAQQMEALNTEHQNKMSEISKDAAQKEANERALEWQNRILEAKNNGEEYLQIELDRLQEQLDNLHQLEGESDAEFKNRMLQAQSEYLAKKKQMANAEIQIEKAKYQAASQFAGQLSDLLETVAGDNKEMVQASKVLALAEVAIKQGVAIADAVAASAAGDPYTYALRVAAAIASTVTAMAQAISSINSAKFAKGTSYVNGPGTETSDSIPALLSRGEGVVTARANRMFPGLVQAMNDMAAGVATPARVFNSSSVVNNYTTQSTLNQIADNTERRLVVSVEEIHRVEDNVEAIENLSTI